MKQTHTPRLVDHDLLDATALVRQQHCIRICMVEHAICCFYWITSLLSVSIRCQVSPADFRSRIEYRNKSAHFQAFHFSSHDLGYFQASSIRYIAQLGTTQSLHPFRLIILTNSKSSPGPTTLSFVSTHQHCIRYVQMSYLPTSQAPNQDAQQSHASIYTIQSAVPITSHRPPSVDILSMTISQEIPTTPIYEHMLAMLPPGKEQNVSFHA